MDTKLLELADHIANKCIETKSVIATAESCTGGQIAYILTSIPGSSQWFERGYVTYSNEAKQENLGVPKHCIEQFGAVSQETAIAMAEGSLRHSNATISVVSTGIAGPGGGSKEKPVGTVFLAWAKQDMPTIAKQFLFSGDRKSIRDLTTEQALLGLLNIVSQKQ